MRHGGFAPPDRRTTTPRILHIKGSSPFGGDCVLMLELAREARRRGYEVDVLATDEHFAGLIREEGFGLVDLDVIRREIRPAWDLRGLLRLIAFLQEERYTIVHTHTSKPGVVGTLAARRAGVPAVVHTLHLLPFHEETGPLARAAYVRAERRAARWCDRLVAVSEVQRRWALEAGIGDEQRVVAIPNGVPTDRVQATRARAAVRTELCLGDAFTVVSTGRLAEQKGLEYLIRAAPVLRERLPMVRIVLAGDGPLRDRLADLVAELGVGDVVRLLGIREDVGDLLAAADVVALPSLWEGLSISLLEAMAAGRPVVTTDIAANREVTDDGEAAVLVPPKDPGALAEAILDLARDAPRRARLGETGRAVQRRRYTMPRMLEAYFEQYDELLRPEGSAKAVALAGGAL